MPEVITEKSSIEQIDLITRNRLQAELIKRSERPAEEWIDEISEIFSEIVEKSEIIDLIKKDENEALIKIEKLIEEKKKREK